MCVSKLQELKTPLHTDRADSINLLYVSGALLKISLSSSLMHSPLQEIKKETLAKTAILFCPVAWLWAFDIAMVVLEALGEAWRIYRGEGFHRRTELTHLTFPAGIITKYQSSDIRDSTRTLRVLCQPVLLSSFRFNDITILAKWFQGWDAGSLQRNGFLQDRFLIKHRAGPMFSPWQCCPIICQSLRKLTYQWGEYF